MATIFRKLLRGFWLKFSKVGRGYLAIYDPTDPNANNRGYVPYHRWLVGKHNDRRVSKRKVVHHKDGNKLNNELSNLVVMLRSNHTKLHNSGAPWYRQASEN